MFLHNRLTIEGNLAMSFSPKGRDGDPISTL